MCYICIVKYLNIEVMKQLGPLKSRTLFYEVMNKSGLSHEDLLIFQSLFADGHIYFTGSRRSFWPRYCCRVDPEFSEECYSYCSPVEDILSFVNCYLFKTYGFAHTPLRR